MSLNQPNEELMWALLAKGLNDWNLPSAIPSQRGVYIRLLYWYSDPDRNGNWRYWGEWVYIWDRFYPFRELLELWADTNTCGLCADDFYYYAPELGKYIDEDDAPRDYDITHAETIIVQHPEDLDSVSEVSD